MGTAHKLATGWGTATALAAPAAAAALHYKYLCSHNGVWL